MVPVILRIATGLALGVAAGLLWRAQRRRTQSPVRAGKNARIDEAVEDTFPASDPPAFMQSVVAGSPPRAHDDAAVAGGIRSSPDGL